MNKQDLPLKNMAHRHSGLTPFLAGTYIEAASVCLDIHHTPPETFTLENDNSQSLATVDWQQPDNRCKAAWANIDDAARDGAYACALAATELIMGFYAIKRAEKLTGADYYIGPSHCTADDLEDCYRLEVSGTNMDSNEVYKRLRNKVTQAQKGQSSLPAIAAVVGFKVK